MNDRAKGIPGNKENSGARPLSLVLSVKGMRQGQWYMCAHCQESRKPLCA